MLKKALLWDENRNQIETRTGFHQFYVKKKKVCRCFASFSSEKEHFTHGMYIAALIRTVKSWLSECRLSETTGLFEDNGQSRLFSLLSIATKLPIIRISIIRKIQFFEVIPRSRLKKLLLNYSSSFEVQKSRMVITISLFGRVWFTHLSGLANKVATGNWHRLKFTLLRDEPLSD